MPGLGTEKGSQDPPTFPSPNQATVFCWVGKARLCTQKDKPGIT